MVVLAVSLFNWAGSLAGVRETSIHERSPMFEPFFMFVVVSLAAIIASLGLSMLYQVRLILPWQNRSLGLQA